MCELLGMSANVPTDICFSFTGLVQRGGGTGPHKDGWGITFYEGKGCRTFKDPQPSFNSPIAKLVQDYPIKSCSVVAHIRQANRGEVALENTHPFTRELWGRNWTYAHNGQLTANALETTTRYQSFKTAGTIGIKDCKIKSLILPLLADHVLREANHYLRILKNK